MSVAKNTLVSGSREKSLEIITLRPPPQAARTGVCDRLSRQQSSRRRTSARSSPKPTLRSSPSPDSAALSTYGLSPYFILLAPCCIEAPEHWGNPTADRSATTRKRDTRVLRISGRATRLSQRRADFLSGLLAEHRDLGQTRRGHPIHRPRHAQRGPAAPERVGDRDGDTVEPVLKLAESRRPTLRSDAIELRSQILGICDRLFSKGLQGHLEGYFLGRILRESQQHLAVGGGVGLRLPANPVTHPDQMSPVNLGYVDDFAILETG